MFELDGLGEAAIRKTLACHSAPPSTRSACCGFEPLPVRGPSVSSLVFDGLCSARTSAGKGLIFGPSGVAMTPAHTRKGGKLYRYYVSTDVLKRDADSCLIRRVPAGEIETAVIDQLPGLLRAPEIIVRTWRAARQSGEEISEGEAREAIERLDPLWDELFPAEQARIVQLLVERVDVGPDGLDIRLRTEGLTNLVADLRAVRPGLRRAA
jgi:site-specific DNA recombinase